jgi:hypothetical protein
MRLVTAWLLFTFIFLPSGIVQAWEDSGEIEKKLRRKTDRR